VDSPYSADAAGRILQALEIPMEINSTKVFPQASVGICLVDRKGPTPEAAELLRNADVAMYRAKRATRAATASSSRPCTSTSSSSWSCAAELEQTIDADQLELQYQPLVRLKGQEISAWKR